VIIVRGPAGSRAACTVDPTGQATSQAVAPPTPWRYATFTIGPLSPPTTEVQGASGHFPLDNSHPSPARKAGKTVKLHDNRGISASPNRLQPIQPLQSAIRFANGGGSLSRWEEVYGIQKTFVSWASAVSLPSSEVNLRSRFVT
jgi:hypothetical protein